MQASGGLGRRFNWPGVSASLKAQSVTFNGILYGIIHTIIQKNTCMIDCMYDLYKVTKVKNVFCFNLLNISILKERVHL